MNITQSNKSTTDLYGNTMKMECSNALLLNPKAVMLKQAVKSYKQLGFKFNLVEIAAFAGISTGSAHNKKSNINRYWFETNMASSMDKQFAYSKSMEFVLKGVQNLEEAFGAILGVHLKMETDILDSADSLKEVKKLGEQITKIYRLVCNYKNTKGVPVHSGNKSAKYLLESKINLDKLFVRSNDYVLSQRSKRWQATKLLKQYIKVSINYLLDIISDLDICGSYGSVNISHYMSPKETTKSTYNNTIYNINNNIYNNIIAVNIHSIREFEINSIFNLLVRAVKVTKDEIFVPISHEASTDESLGRSYNVFSRIRSKERLKLGYISYDINAALQSVSLQLIKAKKEDYPMLWNYTHDKEYKERIRTEVAKTLGISSDDVKAKLTAFANGSISGIKLHRHYKEFQAESDMLRKTVLSHVKHNELEVFEHAISQSKRELPQELDWTDTDIKETTKEMRDKASVFFFIWTWYERQIRQAMLTVLTDGIELHNAVYSKTDIPAKIVEDAVMDLSGFDIIIEKESLYSKKDCFRGVKLLR